MAKGPKKVNKTEAVNLPAHVHMVKDGTRTISTCIGKFVDSICNACGTWRYVVSFLWSNHSSTEIHKTVEEAEAGARKYFEDGKRYDSFKYAYVHDLSTGLCSLMLINPNYVEPKSAEQLKEKEEVKTEVCDCKTACSTRESKTDKLVVKHTNLNDSKIPCAGSFVSGVCQLCGRFQYGILIRTNDYKPEAIHNNEIVIPAVYAYCSFTDVHKQIMDNRQLILNTQGSTDYYEVVDLDNGTVLHSTKDKRASAIKHSHNDSCTKACDGIFINDRCVKCNQHRYASTWRNKDGGNKLQDWPNQEEGITHYSGYIDSSDVESKKRQLGTQTINLEQNVKEGNYHEIVDMATGKVIYSNKALNPYFLKSAIPHQKPDNANDSCDGAFGDKNTCIRCGRNRYAAVAMTDKDEIWSEKHKSPPYLISIEFASLDGNSERDFNDKTGVSLASGNYNSFAYHNVYDLSTGKVVYNTKHVYKAYVQAIEEKKAKEEAEKKAKEEESKKAVTPYHRTGIHTIGEPCHGTFIDAGTCKTCLRGRYGIRHLNKDGTNVSSDPIASIDSYLNIADGRYQVNLFNKSPSLANTHYVLVDHVDNKVVHPEAVTNIKSNHLNGIYITSIPCNGIFDSFGKCPKCYRGRYGVKATDRKTDTSINVNPVFTNTSFELLENAKSYADRHNKTSGEYEWVVVDHVNGEIVYRTPAPEKPATHTTSCHANTSDDCNGEFNRKRPGDQESCEKCGRYKYALRYLDSDGKNMTEGGKNPLQSYIGFTSLDDYAKRNTDDENKNRTDNLTAVIVDHVTGEVVYRTPLENIVIETTKPATPEGWVASYNTVTGALVKEMLDQEDKKVKDKIDEHISTLIADKYGKKHFTATKYGGSKIACDGTFDKDTHKCTKCNIPQYALIYRNADGTNHYASESVDGAETYTVQITHAGLSCAKSSYDTLCHGGVNEKNGYYHDIIDLVTGEIVYSNRMNSRYHQDKAEELIKEKEKPVPFFSHYRSDLYGNDKCDGTFDARNICTKCDTKRYGTRSRRKKDDSLGMSDAICVGATFQAVDAYAKKTVINIGIVGDYYHELIDRGNNNKVVFSTKSVSADNLETVGECVEVAAVICDKEPSPETKEQVFKNGWNKKKDLPEPVPHRRYHRHINDKAICTGEFNIYGICSECNFKRFTIQRVQYVSPGTKGDRDYVHAMWIYDSFDNLQGALKELNYLLTNVHEKDYNEQHQIEYRIIDNQKGKVIASRIKDEQSLREMTTILEMQPEYRLDIAGK